MAKCQQMVFKNISDLKTSKWYAHFIVFINDKAHTVCVTLAQTSRQSPRRKSDEQLSYSTWSHFWRELARGTVTPDQIVSKTKKRRQKWNSKKLYTSSIHKQNCYAGLILAARCNDRTCSTNANEFGLLICYYASDTDRDVHILRACTHIRELRVEKQKSPLALNNILFHD